MESLWCIPSCFSRILCYYSYSTLQILSNQKVCYWSIRIKSKWQIKYFILGSYLRWERAFYFLKRNAHKYFYRNNLFKLSNNLILIMCLCKTFKISIYTSFFLYIFYITCHTIWILQPCYYFDDYRLKKKNWINTN